ncbi:MAG: CBS domain-containing protein [Pseudomonadota bacterium]
MTTVTTVMTRNVRTLTPKDTISLAASAMAELNVGVIPVSEGGKLLGMVTDRDIVLRAVARGRDGSTPLSEVMSTDVQTARDTDDLDSVLAGMSAGQIRRLPVVDGAGKLVGIISIGDIASKAREEKDVGQSLGEISAPAASGSKAS